MRTYDIKNNLDRCLGIFGAMGFDIRGKGISPRRLPDWTRPQVPALMDVMLRMPSGVRIVFDTDATIVRLTALSTTMVVGEAAVKPVVCDFETSGSLHSSQSRAGNVILLDPMDQTRFEFKAGVESSFEFTGLPAGEKTCQLWLPQNAYIELRELSVNEGATLTLAPKDSRPKWIHYGSSISHCFEADQPALIWPAVAARISGVCMQNLGFAGECHLDQFIARVIRDSDANLISLKIGINIVNRDSMGERVFTSSLHGFLDTIRELKKSTPILLISPIFCPSAEDNPGPTIAGSDGKFRTIPGHEEVRGDCLTLNRIREVIQAVIESRADENLMYLDGRELFGEADREDLPDDLHPSAAGYIRMGKRFASAYLTDAVTGLN